MSRVPAAATLVVALLGACATTTPTRFHSLLPPPEAASAATASAVPAQSPFDLAPVRVAVAVDRPQFVLRQPDGTMQLLEHERWIAPLGDELHAALGLHLAALTAPAGDGTGGLAAGPWRLVLEVRRWDATLGGPNRLEALWTVRRGSGPARHCQAVLEQPAGATADALAASHRTIVGRLADRLAASVRGC